MVTWWSFIETPNKHWDDGEVFSIPCEFLKLYRSLLDTYLPLFRTQALAFRFVVHTSRRFAFAIIFGYPAIPDTLAPRWFWPCINGFYSFWSHIGSCPDAGSSYSGIALLVDCPRNLPFICEAIRFYWKKSVINYSRCQYLPCIELWQMFSHRYSHV